MVRLKLKLTVSLFHKINYTLITTTLVSGPESDTSFSIEKCNDIYKVTYIPLEIGVFDIKILWNGQEIPSTLNTLSFQYGTLTLICYSLNR